MEISFNIYDSINNTIFLFENTKEDYFLSKSIFEKYIFDNWELNYNTINENNNIHTNNNNINKEQCNNEYSNNEYCNNEYNNNENKIKQNLYINEKNSKNIPSYPEKKIDKSSDKIKENINIDKFNKKLYRKIAVKSHPDKVKNKEKNFLFVKANQFYENNLTIGLIFIAKKLKIEINIRNIKLIKYLLEEINLTKNKIEQMKNSFYWIWNNSSPYIKNIIEEKYTKENNLVKKNINKDI